MSQIPECHRTVTVTSENGLHLGPCSMVAKLAKSFQSDIRIRKSDKTVDAKSVFDLMILAASHGSTLELEARGDDAEEAICQLVHLFENNFDLGGSAA
jgi:phosphotransferase system HPr (HPr) family protein